MATTIQDELYRTFLTVSGQQASALSDVSMTLADVLAEVHEMQSAVPPANVKGATAAATPQASSSDDVLSSVASTVLKSGFGLAPLVSGLVGLFSGGDAPAPAPLVKYALPAAVDFQASETASGITGVDYDQAGMPRAYNATSSAGQTMGADGPAASASSNDSTRPAPQITVNVQAMDARSFMDRSSEIALAVRDAMLNMNAINDVVNEL
jgi:hypothetical protein